MTKFIYGLFFIFISGGGVYAAEPLKADITWSWNGDKLKYVINSVSSSSGKQYRSCIFVGSCQISIDYASGTGALKDHFYPLGQIPAGTLSNIANKVTEKDLPITNVLDGGAQYKECYYVKLHLTPSSFDSSAEASTCDGSATPPPISPPLPPEKVICTLSDNSTLDHGTLSASAVVGHSTDVFSMLFCTGKATAKIKVTDGKGSDMLKLADNGSLYSTLKVNGQKGSIGINISIPGEGGAPLLFSSELSVNGTPSSGSFSASAVATVEVL